MKAKSKGKSKKAHKKVEGHDARGALLDAAAAVFAEKGFEGATVKDIADHAQVNVGLVSYYFDGKEGLYRACLEHFALERLQISKTLLQPAASYEEFRVRLQLWTEQVIELNIKQRHFPAIMHRGLYGQDPIIREVLEKKFREGFKTLEEFFVQAQKKNIIRTDIDIIDAPVLFFGGVMHAMYRKYFECLFSGKKEMNEAYFKNLAAYSVQIFLEGIQVR